MLAVVFLTIFWSKVIVAETDTPGQFPIQDADENQVAWPSTEAVGGYRPPPSWAIDPTYTAEWSMDPKRIVGLRLDEECR